MRRSLVLSLFLAVLTGSLSAAELASADTLGTDFVFPSVWYRNTIFDVGPPLVTTFTGHGTGGQFMGMGNLIVDLRYGPDREGGHPLARFLGFQGGIPELGIPFHYDPQGTCTILCAAILEDPDVQELGNSRYLVTFLVGVEETDPLLGLNEGFTENWIALVVGGPATASELFDTTWRTPAIPGLGLAALGLAALGIRRAVRQIRVCA